MRKKSLSSRACHSVLKLARTIADLAGRERLVQADVMEALQHRRHDENEPIWSSH